VCVGVESVAACDGLWASLDKRLLVVMGGLCLPRLKDWLCVQMCDKAYLCIHECCWGMPWGVM
jgi:hypothetical protein